MKWNLSFARNLKLQRIKAYNKPPIKFISIIYSLIKIFIIKKKKKKNVYYYYSILRITFISYRNIMSKIFLA